MSLTKPCPECAGEGGHYPIIGEGQTTNGTYYPIEGDWVDCKGECEGTGKVVDHDAYDREELRHDPLRGVA